MQFDLKAPYTPTGDQPQAIEALVAGLEAGRKNQVLLGVTGSGKTFSIANVITRTKLPTLIISHNKTLAGQIYQEMREFFPRNAVSYFVSYYDFYQPEAYIPHSDTYIEKEAEINEQIDKLRLQSTANILSRDDVVVVASVSCIYNIGSPDEYGSHILTFTEGGAFDLKGAQEALARMQYERSEFEFGRGTFRLRSGSLDIFPASEDTGYRIKASLDGKTVESLWLFDPLTGRETQRATSVAVYPAKHFMADTSVVLAAEKQILSDLAVESERLKKEGKLVEAQRLTQRVRHDVEMIKEVGYVNGIENYSRYFDGRKPGDPPYSLLHYFKRRFGNDFLVVIDESHMTVPQVRGMYNGDRSRKEMLVEYGFRLKAAFDNRPMRFDEFYGLTPRVIYTSATPDEWEVGQATAEAKQKKLKGNGIVEQLVRPTGIVDPLITIRPSKGQVPDLVAEIEKRIKANPDEKILVTTLTKRISEDLTAYLKEKGIRATYLHSDVETLERSDILDNLRKRQFDVLVGVNLLREGIDLPEVTLVAILDADKEGFLRSRTALIQTMGRAARNAGGEVIVYADTQTGSLQMALEEIGRRREYQLAFNKEHNITPTTILKPVRERIVEREEDLEAIDSPQDQGIVGYVATLEKRATTPYDKKRSISKLEKEMRRQAGLYQFENAILIRDAVRKLKEQK